ncbi:MAG: hypothetical protein HXY45_09820 [Syntrophaceae bacterium]|nr:hypothetical protein [Syntrophaceae bacterium]
MSEDKYLGYRTLIAGEVHAGKTAYTLDILRGLREKHPSNWAILDLAPEKTRRVGGKVPLTVGEKEEILYFSPLISPPRMMGRNETEVRRLAQENRQRIDPLLSQIKKRALPFLLVNDITLYFQDGKAEHFLSFIEGIPTVIMNGYYGRYFGDSPFSRAERTEMESLMCACDRVIFLPPVSLG